MKNIDINNLPAILERMKLVTGATSYKKLAFLLGHSPSWLSNYVQAAKGSASKTGVRKLPITELVNWAIGSNVSIDWLLTGQESEPTTTTPCPENTQAEGPGPWCLEPYEPDPKPLGPTERRYLEKCITVLRAPAIRGRPDNDLIKAIDDAHFKILKWQSDQAEAGPEWADDQGNEKQVG